MLCYDLGQSEIEVGTGWQLSAGSMDVINSVKAGSFPGGRTTHKPVKPTSFSDDDATGQDSGLQEENLTEETGPGAGPSRHARSCLDGQ